MGIKGFWSVRRRLGPFATYLAAAAVAIAGCSAGDPSEKAAETASSSAQTPAGGVDHIDPQSFPEVVARVNGTQITQSDLVSRAKAVAGAHEGSAEAGQAFYREVLDDLVSAELLFQESVAKGFAPSEEEVEERVAMIRSRFNSPAEFENALARQGLTEEKMKRALRKDLGIERMLQKEVISTISVDDAAVRQWYEENREKIRSDDEVLVSHILIRADRGASPAEKEAAQKKAEQLRKRALAGEDFAALARENSEDPGSAQLGGDLSWFGRGSMVRPFEDAAYKLEKGQISPVVATPFGFHVLKMADRRPGKLLNFEDTKDQIAEFLKEKAIQEKIGAKVAVLKEDAKIEILI